MNRTRQQLDEEAQCGWCAGSGVDTYYGWTCHRCQASGLNKPPKMRAECECGQRQPRFTTRYTAANWMQKHLASHAPEEPDLDAVGVGEQPQ